MSDDDARRDQLERAQQAWELRVLDSPDPVLLDAVRRVLRIKRFELERFAARLPGPVRRGARVDLEPLQRKLEQSGIRCELVRRT